jgi:hypothetical protein
MTSKLDITKLPSYTGHTEEELRQYIQTTLTRYLSNIGLKLTRAPKQAVINEEIAKIQITDKPTPPKEPPTTRKVLRDNVDINGARMTPPMIEVTETIPDDEYAGLKKVYMDELIQYVSQMAIWAETPSSFRVKEVYRKVHEAYDLATTAMKNALVNHLNEIHEAGIEEDPMKMMEWIKGSMNSGGTHTYVVTTFQKLLELPRIKRDNDNSVLEFQREFSGSVERCKGIPEIRL